MAAITLIKLVHTIVWAFLAGTILVMPLLVWRRRWRVVTVLMAILFLECLALALNGMRCPLTNIAERYTSDRAANFDIFLPEWLARNNKLIFGTLFAGDLVLVAGAALRGANNPKLRG